MILGLALAKPVAADPLARLSTGELVYDEIPAARLPIELPSEEYTFYASKYVAFYGSGMWNPGNENEGATVIVEDPTIDLTLAKEHGPWSFELVVNNALEWPEAVAATASVSFSY